MRNPLKSLVAGIATLAVAGVMIAAGASAASAVAPPYDPEPDAFGTITFYDAAGAVVTSGTGTTSTDPKYAVASANPTVAVEVRRGALYGYLPVAGVHPGLWSGLQISSSTAYPINSAPASVSSLAFPATLRNGGAAGDASFLALASVYPQVTTGDLANVYQIRLREVESTEYASASVTINQTTGAWQQVFPVVADSTKTVLTTTASPAIAPASPTLTATVTRTADVGTKPAGTVEFFDGATSLGTPSAVDANGIAVKALTGVAEGTKSYTAVFAPTTATAFLPSTSSASAYVVEAAKVATNVALATSGAVADVNAPVTFTATVTTGTPAIALAAGTVEFFDGAVSLAPAAAPNAAGEATLTTSALVARVHSVTAKFVPTDAVKYNGSTSSAVSVTVQTVLLGACAANPANCTDGADFVAEVAAGSLVISTPFHGANPFNLGTLALNAEGTELSSGAKSFKAQDPALKGITITDTRAADNNWTASLSSSDFVSGLAKIAAKNLGFTAVNGSYIAGNALQAGDVLFADHAASSVATPTAGLAGVETFATAATGVGTVYVDGNFTLNAPTSTKAGTYLGTVTFTIA